MENKQVKIRSICIDTLTAIMSNQYMTDANKPGFSKWVDLSQGIWQLIEALHDLEFEIIMIIGEPGTGKSSGMMTLPHNTNIWYNADKKNPIWKGGRQEYGTKKNPRSPYHVIPKTYNDIFAHLKKGLDSGKFEDDRFAILTGHVEPYKIGDDYNKRLKVIGNLTKRMDLEGKLDNVLYSSVIMKDDKHQYVLETHNDGYNTARTPMDLFEDTIPNDYNFVIKKLLEFTYGTENKNQ